VSVSLATTDIAATQPPRKRHELGTAKMTKEEIDQKIEDLRIASRKIKGAQRQLAYLHDLQKYEKLLKEKHGVNAEDLHSCQSRVADFPPLSGASS
jgi:hypothetical protein